MGTITVLADYRRRRQANHSRTLFNEMMEQAIAFGAAATRDPVLAAATRDPVLAAAITAASTTMACTRCHRHNDLRGEHDMCTQCVGEINTPPHIA